MTNTATVADTIRGLYNCMDGYSEPACIFINPAHWRQIKVIIRFHEIFKKRIKSDWREIKPKFPPKKHTRWVQRLYVMHVHSESWAQAKREIEAEEASERMQ